MRNIKLIVEYDGSGYCGWQVQAKGDVTIQEILQAALRKIIHEKINVIASGRTDSGVHSLGQVVNFETASKIPISKLALALNSILPDDIAVRGLQEPALDFHSRFSAKSKIYRYIIRTDSTKGVFLKEYYCHIKYPLNIRIMKSEARSLLGRHDFSSFCASNTKIKNPIRSIKRILIKKVSFEPFGDNFKLLVIDIEADGFLYNMVRNIVGTLLEIGRGKFKKGSLKKILEFKNRTKAGPTAPAKGLFLLKVKYK